MQCLYIPNPRDYYPLPSLLGARPTQGGLDSKGVVPQFLIVEPRWNIPPSEVGNFDPGIRALDASTIHIAILKFEHGADQAFVCSPGPPVHIIPRTISSVEIYISKQHRTCRCHHLPIYTFIHLPLDELAGRFIVLLRAFQHSQVRVASSPRVVVFAIFITRISKMLRRSRIVTVPGFFILVFDIAVLVIVRVGIVAARILDIILLRITSNLFCISKSAGLERGCRELTCPSGPRGRPIPVS